MRFKLYIYPLNTVTYLTCASMYNGLWEISTYTVGTFLVSTHALFWETFMEFGSLSYLVWLRRSGRFNDGWDFTSPMPPGLSLWLSLSLVLFRKLLWPTSETQQTFRENVRVIYSRKLFHAKILLHGRSTGIAYCIIIGYVLLFAPATQEQAKASRNGTEPHWNKLKIHVFSIQHRRNLKRSVTGRNNWFISFRWVVAE